jgi:hypothetical protein
VDEVAELGEAAAYRQVDTDAQNQEHHGETPDDAVNFAVNVGNHFDH